MSLLSPFIFNIFSNSLIFSDNFIFLFFSISISCSNSFIFIFALSLFTGELFLVKSTNVLDSYYKIILYNYKHSTNNNNIKLYTIL